MYVCEKYTYSKTVFEKKTHGKDRLYNKSTQMFWVAQFSSYFWCHNLNKPQVTPKTPRPGCASLTRTPPKNNNKKANNKANNSRAKNNKKNTANNNNKNREKVEPSLLVKQRS